MTALQVINEIKAMQPEEREQVVQFLRQFEGKQEIRFADDQQAEEASEQILDRHAELMRKLAS